MDLENNHPNIVEIDESVVKDKLSNKVNWVIAIVLVIILGSIYAYFYFVQTQLNEVTEEIPAITPTPVETVETIDPAFAEEKLQEIDQGQGLVGIHLKDGRDLFLTDPISGRSLYQLSDGFCTDECLQNWVPLSGSEAFEGTRIRSVLVNEEFNLHYVLLDDKMLFTYVGDSIEGDINGEGLDGEWTLARP